MVICLVWMRRLANGMGVGVRSMPTGSFGRKGLMLQDPKPPMNLKETSLTTHPDASMKMNDINKKTVYLKLIHCRDRIFFFFNANVFFLFCQFVIIVNSCLIRSSLIALLDFK